MATAQRDRARLTASPHPSTLFVVLVGNLSYRNDRLTRQGGTRARARVTDSSDRVGGQNRRTVAPAGTRSFSMGTRLYVGNLPFSADENSIRELLSPGGRRVREVNDVPGRA